MRIVPALPMAEWNEDQWQTFLIGTKSKPGLARTLGYSAYHTLRSKGSEAGWPDWALYRPGRFLLLELKHDGRESKCSPAQRATLSGLLEAGVEVYVARPRNLEAIQWTLQQRTRPTDPSSPHLTELEGELAKEIQ